METVSLGMTGLSASVTSGGGGGLWEAGKALRVFTSPTVPRVHTELGADLLRGLGLASGRLGLCAPWVVCWLLQAREIACLPELVESVMVIRQA